MGDQKQIKILKREKVEEVLFSQVVMNPEAAIQLQLQIVCNKNGRQVSNVSINQKKQAEQRQTPREVKQSRYFARRKPLEEIPNTPNPARIISNLILLASPQNVNENITELLNIESFHSIECYGICIDAIHQRLLSVTNQVPTMCYIKIIEAIRAQNRPNVFDAIERKLDFSSKIFICLLQRSINRNFVDDIGFGQKKRLNIMSELESISLPRRLFRIYSFLMELYLMKFISGAPILECLSGLEKEIKNGQENFLPLLKLMLNQTMKSFIDRYPEYIKRLSGICKNSSVAHSAIEIDEKTLNKFSTICALEEHMAWLKVTVSIKWEIVLRFI